MNDVIESPRKKNEPVRRTRLLKILLPLVGALIILVSIIAVLAGRASLYIKHRVEQELSQRFDSTVELRALRVAAFPSPRVVAEDLVLRLHGDASLPPIIAVKHFDFDASFLGLLRWPLNIGSVNIVGLSISVPPRDKRPAQSGDKDRPPAKSIFVIGRLVADHARLEIQTERLGKLPLVFDIESLVLHSAGPGRAMAFSAKLVNPKPVGDIDAKGEFGPWQTGAPRETPVSGVYAFTNADLATIRGIGGTLSSQGKFAGLLDRIEVEGKTNTANFSVSTGGHPVPLYTDFNATVDGSTGDTYLHPVRATLLNSRITANGSIVRQHDGGHLITLDTVANDALIEDLLRVAVKTDPPTLSGPVRCKARLILPPGSDVVADRLLLDGSFTLPAARFLNPQAQRTVDQLSLRAEGHAKEAKSGDITDVFSQLHGNFKLANGVVSLSDLAFAVPGAAVRLSGDYRLSDQEFLFRGDVRTQARVSQMTTGVKSFFLKALDPFFAKKGAGAIIPIRVSGTGTSPSVHLDFGHPATGSR